MYRAVTRQIEVTVEPNFMPGRSSAAEGQYFWSYTIVSEITDPTNPIPLPPGVGGGLIGLASVAVARRWMKR